MPVRNVLALLFRYSGSPSSWEGGVNGGGGGGRRGEPGGVRLGLCADFLCRSSLAALWGDPLSAEEARPRNGRGEPGGCLLSRATTAAKERWKPNNQWHMSSYDCAFMKTCLLPPSNTRRKACSPCCGAVPTTLTVVRAHLATNLPRRPGATASSSKRATKSTSSPSLSSLTVSKECLLSPDSGDCVGARTVNTPPLNSPSQGRHSPCSSSLSSCPQTEPRLANRSSSTARRPWPDAWE